jgi:hypothetical protein
VGPESHQPQRDVDLVERDERALAPEAGASVEKQDRPRGPCAVCGAIGHTALVHLSAAALRQPR